MLGIVAGLIMIAGVQDVPPLAGSLPPMPPPRSGPRPDEDRPRGRLFISPMGEPFRAPDPVKAWFDNADTNKDGVITLPEFVADADRFFQRLDRGHDGEIDPDDIDYYETVLAPEIRTGGAGAMMGGGGGGGGRGRGRGGGGGGGRRGPQSSGGGFPNFSADGGAGSGGGYSSTKRGAGRYSFFDYPEPVTVADTNFNRGVDPKEFRDAAIDRFGMLDKNHDGKLTRGELPELAAPPPGGRWQGRGGMRRPGGDGPPSDDGGGDQ